jgi:dihydroflavonol-4-reductase
MRADSFPKKVFLTGASGFLGKVVLQKLAEEKIPVIAYTRKPFQSSLANVENSVGGLDDEKKLSTAIKGCDAIIHCAGMVDFDESNLGEMRKVHVDALRTLLQLAEKSGVKKIVYVSSHWTIGYSMSEQPLDEEDILSPDGRIHNPYQRTKFEAEQLIERWKSRKVEIVMVNPSQIWGPANRNEVFREYVGQARSKRFFIVPSGGINIVHASDVARGILLAVKKGKDRQRYILSSHDLTFVALSRKFLDINKRKGLVIEIPRFVTRPCIKLMFLILDLVLPGLGRRLTPLRAVDTYKFYSWKKAGIELGYKPRKMADEIIKEALSEQFG